jgi:hypothetical protein
MLRIASSIFSSLRNTEVICLIGIISSFEDYFCSFANYVITLSNMMKLSNVRLSGLNPTFIDSTFLEKRCAIKKQVSRITFINNCSKPRATK